mgnify:CR=1 FL=1
MTHGRIYSDRKFYGCTLTIFTENKKGYISVRVIYLGEEYSEPMTLTGIRERFNDERKILVIAEKPLKGHIYRFGNHGQYWEYIGDTTGYA